MKFVIRPIFLILVVALVVRLWGIAYGLPLFLVNDERAGVYGALKMIELKTLVPVWHDAEFRTVLNYLPLPSYLYLIALVPVLGIGYLVSGAPDPEAYRAALTLDPTPIFIAARALMALLGTLSVYLTYRLGRSVFQSERAGLLAAMFLAVSFYHVQVSHVTRHWMPALVAINVALLASVAVYRSGRLRSYLWAGLTAGLGVGSNTAAAGAMIPVAAAHFLRPGEMRWHRRLTDRRLLAAVGAFLGISLLFIAIYPYGLTQGEIPGGGLGDTLAKKYAMLARLFDGATLGEFVGYFVWLAFTYETALAAMALIGTVLALRTHSWWLAMSALYALGYFLALYLFFGVIVRGILFVLPIAAVFAGYAVDRLLHWFQPRIRPTFTAALSLFAISTLLFFAWPLVLALRYDQLLARPDTRLAALEWMYANTPAGAKILADTPYLRLTNTKAGIKELERIDPAGLRIQDRALLAVSDQRYPQRSREVLNLHFVSRDSPYRNAGAERLFSRRGYRYLVLESSYEDLRDVDPLLSAIAAKSRQLVRIHGFRRDGFGRALDLSGEIDTVRPWRLWELTRFGLIVDVYALDEREPGAQTAPPASEVL